MGSTPVSGSGLTLAVVLAATALGLAGCSDSLPSLPRLNDLNPFAEKQQPLPGRRIPIMQARETLPGELAAADRPLVLPQQRANDSWAQPGGQPNNAPGHLALGGSLKQAWSVDAGTGSSTSSKLTSSPIVYDGRVYVLDAVAEVRAFSTGGGGGAWRQSLVPDNEKGKESYGGGLAADGGRLFAATGFGTVVALDPAGGKRLWEKSLGVPVRASPTASGDKVFIAAIDGRVFALAAADGSELWVHRGLPEKQSLISNPSPAVEGDVVVVPYPSGEVVALRASDGQPLWSESLARTRTASSLTSMSDAARPAIDGGIVYAVGHAGRMVATQQRTGERLWSLNVPGTQAPWVAGDAVFVVDTSGQVMAVTRRDGKVIWTTKLPGGGTWSGPTLAGGMLWLAGSSGSLVGVEASSGKLAQTLNVGKPVYIAPVVAQGRLYVLTDSARLIAFN